MKVRPGTRIYFVLVGPTWNYKEQCKNGHRANHYCCQSILCTNMHRLSCEHSLVDYVINPLLTTSYSLQSFLNACPATQKPGEVQCAPSAVNGHTYCIIRVTSSFLTCQAVETVSKTGQKVVSALPNMSSGWNSKHNRTESCLCSSKMNKIAEEVAFATEDHWLWYTAEQLGRHCKCKGGYNRV